MIKWGMVGNSHDASLAVFKDNKLLWACLAKDFSDIPNDPDFNWTQISVALQSYGPPSRIYWYERPGLKTLRQWYAGQGGLYHLHKENNIKDYLSRWDIDAPITYTQHHLSHAAYAYYTQPHDDCAVICLDSIGEFETLTMWHGKNNKLKKVYSQGYPHSIGLFYSAMTQRIGLQAQRDEYMIADLAKHGNPERLSSTIKKEILGTSRKHFTTKTNLHRGCRWWRPELNSKKDIADIAAATQAIFEDTLLRLSAEVKWATNSKYLALAGGGALNRQGVDKIRLDWKDVWVPPNPGDPGSCIGTVLAHTKTKVELDKHWYKKV